MIEKKIFNFLAFLLIHSQVLIAESNVSDVLEAALKEMKSLIPVEINENTKWTGIRLANGNTVVYSYKLLNMQDKQRNKSKLQASLNTALINNYCKSRDLSFYRDNDIAAHYEYFDENNTYLFIIKIGSKQCLN